MTFIHSRCSNLHGSAPVPYTTLFRSAAPARRPRSQSRTAVRGAQSLVGGAGCRYSEPRQPAPPTSDCAPRTAVLDRSEEHTYELQSQFHIVCRLLLEKKNNKVQVLQT